MPPCEQQYLEGQGFSCLRAGYIGPWIHVWWHMAHTPPARPQVHHAPHQPWRSCTVSPNTDKERNHRTQHHQERIPRRRHCRRRRCWQQRRRRRRRRRRRSIGARPSDEDEGSQGHPACRAAAKAPRRARRRRRGERRSEPFVGCFIPWHNCHGGAWNETLLITHTCVTSCVRIEWDQQHWQAEKSGFRNLGISMDIPRIYHGYTSNDVLCISMDIPRIYLVDIHGISMDIPRISTLLDIRGISMNISCISHVYRSGRHIHGVYVVYTRHILKIRVPDAHHACQCHILSIWADTKADKSSFTDQVDMTGIWQEYTCHMSASASAALLGACLARVFPALSAAAPLHCDLLQIFSVLATERLATLGWGRPKFHSQVLASYTWLPLIYLWSMTDW